jgi:hypothetical protein
MCERDQRACWRVPVLLHPRAELGLRGERPDLQLPLPRSVGVVTFGDQNRVRSSDLKATTHAASHAAAADVRSRPSGPSGGLRDSGGRSHSPMPSSIPPDFGEVEHLIVSLSLPTARWVTKARRDVRFPSPPSPPHTHPFPCATGCTCRCLHLPSATGWGVLDRLGELDLLLLPAL